MIDYDEWLKQRILAAVAEAATAGSGVARDSWPPLNPLGEVRVSGDAEFQKECLEEVKNTFPAKPVIITRTLFTENENWGRVWRADFELQGSMRSHLINRAVCWRTPDDALGIMIASQGGIDPLPTPNQKLIL